MEKSQEPKPVVIIGGGFTGLAAAYELAREGKKVIVLESDGELGGLAGGFSVGDTRLERFYHHWFTNDAHVMNLIDELGLRDQVVTRPTATGMYFANSLFRLSSPLDVLKFTPLSVLNRIRLGLLVLQARLYKDWRKLDAISAADWLKRLAGPEVYRIVWEPLLVGKFGKYAEEVSAAWFWAKLNLRGGSRGKGAKENLAYYKGGFIALAERIADFIHANGGEIRLNAPATALVIENGRVTGVRSKEDVIPCHSVVATPALPIIADLLQGHAPDEYLSTLRKVKYLANVCLVLILNKSLSDLYWMNINDPSFPFVGIIEHTNFEPPESYNGRHVVYLSKYLTQDADLYTKTDKEVLEFSLPFVRRMFPKFQDDWIVASHVWRAPYAQPVTSCGFEKIVPNTQTPIDGLHIATMAQIYPEDRGTNYAIRDGRAVAGKVQENLDSIGLTTRGGPCAE